MSYDQYRPDSFDFNQKTFLARLVLLVFCKYFVFIQLKS